MSTEPISKERLDAIVAEYHDAAVLAGKCNPDEMVGMTSAKVACQLFSDVATALRDYARLREENVEAPWIPVTALLPERDLDILLEQRIKHGEVVMRAKFYRDVALQGPRHE